MLILSLHQHSVRYSSAAGGQTAAVYGSNRNSCTANSHEPVQPCNLWLCDHVSYVLTVDASGAGTDCFDLALTSVEVRATLWVGYPKIMQKINALDVSSDEDP